MNLSESYKEKQRKLAGIEPVINEEENKETKKSPIDMKKLTKLAEAIAVLSSGEYGVVYFNEKENSIFIMLGDSNPFDSDDLKYYVQDIVAKNYNESEKIKVEIDFEAHPTGEDWKVVEF